MSSASMELSTVEGLRDYYNETDSQKGIIFVPKLQSGNLTARIVGNSTEISTIVYSSVSEFLCLGLGVSLFSLFGLIGGVLTLCVVTLPTMKKVSMSCLVLYMTVSDTIFVITLFFLFGFRGLFFDFFLGKHYAEDFFALCTPYLVFICDVAQATTYYMKVAISLDRFIAILFPFYARSFCTWKNAQILGTVIASSAFCSYLFSHSYRYFTSDQVTMEQFAEIKWELLKNCSISSEDLPAFSEQLIDNYYESRFFQWPYLTFVIFIPFTALLVFNSALYIELHRIQKRRMEISRQELNAMTAARVCIAIAIVFFLRHLVFVLMATLYGLTTCVWYSVKGTLKDVDIFLFGANPTANFIIYCMMGTNFRKELRQVLLGFKLKLHGGGTSKAVVHAEIKSSQDRRTTSDTDTSSV